MATLYHGMSNAALLVYQGIDQDLLPWLRPSISVLVAMAVLGVTGPNLMRKTPLRQYTGAIAEEPKPGSMLGLDKE